MVLKLDEVIEAVNKVHSLLLDFDELETLRRLLEDSKGKLIMGSSLKSVRKQALKITQRTGDAENKYDTQVQNLLKMVRQLGEALPARKLILEGWVRNIQVNSIYLLQYTAKRRGSLTAILKEAYFDRDRVLQLVARVLGEVLEPLLAVLQELHRYLDENSPIISQELNLKNHLVVNFDAVFIRRNLELPGLLVIIDANFAKELALEKRKERKDLLTLEITGEMIIPRRVYDEMHHHRAGIGPTLVPRSVTEYLLHQLHARVIDVSPLPGEVAEIVRLWRMTVKGGSSSAGDEEKFKKSGDLDILVLALRMQKRPIIILSNDNDISGVVPQFQRPYKYKVRVVRYQEGQILFAA